MRGLRDFPIFSILRSFKRVPVKKMVDRTKNHLNEVPLVLIVGLVAGVGGVLALLARIEATTSGQS